MSKVTSSMSQTHLGHLVFGVTPEASCAFPTVLRRVRVDHFLEIFMHTLDDLHKQIYQVARNSEGGTTAIANPVALAEH